MPFPLRFALIHALATFATLATFPPAPLTPPLAILVVWAASFATALLLLTGFYLLIPRRFRPYRA